MHSKFATTLNAIAKKKTYGTEYNLTLLNDFVNTSFTVALDGRKRIQHRGEEGDQ